MNAPMDISMRRGACPGLSAPMATGDGLLARLTPAGLTIALDAFAGLCGAAQTHGNGIVEITSRGSIQVRGLSAASAPLFAAEVALLGIEASDGIPVLTNPLAGLTDADIFDAHALAAPLRKALAAAPFASRLSAKLSVAIDGGAALHLDGLTADIRMRAVDSGHVHVALAGDAATATPLGVVPLERAVECVVRLFETLAATSPRSRMRDVLQREGLNAFQSASTDIIVDGSTPSARAAADPIGVHPLSSGSNALGVGLPFGHLDSATLLRLIAAARRTGAFGLRTSPGRALLLVGLSPNGTRQFAAEASALGFIIDPSDPRRKVVACAGAPICASGEIAARAIAPAIADAAQSLHDGEIIHISGCAKGCAHPAPAPLAVFGRDGRCDVFADGVLSCSVTAEALPERLAQLVRTRGGLR
jgi:precorrin-3B synthase